MKTYAIVLIFCASVALAIVVSCFLCFLCEKHESKKRREFVANVVYRDVKKKKGATPVASGSVKDGSMVVLGAGVAVAATVVAAAVVSGGGGIGGGGDVSGGGVDSGGGVEDGGGSGCGGCGGCGGD